MTPKTYQLTTLADVFDLPTDRIRACLAELGASFVELKTVAAEPKLRLRLPVQWTDDGVYDSEVNVQRKAP